MDAKDQIYGEVEEKAADAASPPVGVVPALGAKVTSLRFFEADAAAIPSPGQRSYATQFAAAEGRDIGWELDLAHAAPHRWVPLPIEALLYFRGADGEERIMQRKVLQSAVPADARDTRHTDSFGWENAYYYDRAGATTRSPRRWLPGTYWVDLYVLGQKIAGGSFEVR
jgi:hypothetical protein